MKNADQWGAEQQLRFPVVTKQCVNEQGKTVRYLFNYAVKPATVNYPFTTGRELVNGATIGRNKPVQLGPWNVKIIEEQ